MPDNRVILRLGGLDWTYWTSVEVVRRMDALAGAFSISLTDRWSAGMEPLPIMTGMECELLIDNDPLIKGYINKVTSSFGKDTHTLAISGRDRSGDLVDCSAVHSPGQWLGQDALQLCRELAAPFGIKISAQGDIGAAFETFHIEPGETAFEAMDRILKLRELLASPDGKGGLTLIRAGALISESALTWGQNIKAASIDFDETDRFSSYLVQAQQQGSDSVFGLESSAVHAEIADPAVRRHRPLIVRAETVMDNAGAMQRAAWESSVRAARSVSLNVTVQGFRQRGALGGPLWRENSVTQVSIPPLRLNQPMIIAAVTFRRDAQQGTQTLLELKDPKAFKPAPRTETAVYVGNLPPVEAEQDLMSRYQDQAEDAQTQIKEGGV